jgi:monofunctional biosynthetic peptidoglycan transglycosylase
VESGALFEGVVSLENNGGFCSVRSRPEPRDLSGFQGLRLRVRGDGKRYAFRLRTDANWDGVSYQAKFDAPLDAWSWVEIPFEAFVPVFRGRQLRGVPALDPARIHSFGLLIADEQEGEFRLEIHRIEGFAGKPAP